MMDAEKDAEISRLMNAIVEYRAIIAEFCELDQQKVTMVMYRAEHGLTVTEVNRITDLGRFKTARFKAGTNDPASRRSPRTKPKT